jgi:hypothetical protein
VSQLSRAIRLLATRGFLQEQQPGCVAHTPLSAQFITSQSLLDASVFVAESAAPAALQMQISTQRFGAAQGPAEAAMGAMRPFQSGLQERSKLRRQWAAYLRHAAGLHQEEEVLDVISRLNWSNLGNACIVEVSCSPRHLFVSDNRLTICGRSTQSPRQSHDPLQNGFLASGLPCRSMTPNPLRCSTRAHGTAGPMTAVHGTAAKRSWNRTPRRASRTTPPAPAPTSVSPIAPRACPSMSKMPRYTSCTSLRRARDHRREALRPC